MSNIPADLKYTKSHEWVRVEGNMATVGITDHAQHHLGDLVYIDLPEVGDELTAEEDAGVVESVKTASDIYSPVSGKVIAINEKLKTAAETVSKDPYGEGWLFKLEMKNPAEIDNLLTADAYKKIADSDEGEA